MEAKKRPFFTSIAPLIPVLLAAVFAGIERIPEGYEAPITFYFACYLVTLILSIYVFSLEKKRRNSLLTTAIVLGVILFFGFNLENRRLIRWVEKFPDNQALILVTDVMSLPVILLQYIITQLKLDIPWPSGLATSIFLLLMYWGYLVRLLQRMGLEVTSKTSNVSPTRTQYRISSENIERISILLLVLFAGSIRALPTLTGAVPAGADTPFYVAVLQGRYPPVKFGGLLRQLLYYLFRTIGVVLHIPFPTSLHSIWTVNIIPITFHVIAVLLICNLVTSWSKDLKTGVLAGVFLATSVGMLRISWDLYKLLLSIPFALISIQQLIKSIETRDPRRGLLGLSFFVITGGSHATLWGIIFFAVSSLVLVETLFKRGFFSRSQWILCGVLLILLAPWILRKFTDLEGIIFTAWYSGQIDQPLPNKPEIGIVSIVELFRWLGISPLILATLGITQNKGKRDCEFFPSAWLIVSFLLIEQALFHTYTKIGQLHRVELLTAIPVSILAGIGLFKLLKPLRQKSSRKISVPLNMIVVLVLTLSTLAVAWNYGGFLSWTMINEPEYISMTWVIKFAPYTNCGAPRNFDSWTGYYGEIQSYELPTTFFIDRTATDDSPLYHRIYSGFNRIYVRTDLI